MSAAAMYGALSVIPYFLLIEVAPQPFGAVLFWGFLAAQMSWFVTIVCRRIGLPYWTAAGMLGVLISALMVILGLSGRVFPDIPFWAWMAIAAHLVITAFCYAIEGRINRAKWQLWREYMEDMSVWDLCMGRHIPDLRERVARAE